MGASVTIYHNPRCSKSRETLALIESNGIEPQVVEYLKTPPTKEELRGLLKKLGMARCPGEESGPDRAAHRGEGIAGRARPAAGECARAVPLASKSHHEDTKDTKTHEEKQGREINWSGGQLTDVCSLFAWW
jgi:hypothetical protein